MDFMFVTEKNSTTLDNSVGVECVFELFNPAGIVGLRLFSLLQICNP